MGLEERLFARRKITKDGCWEYTFGRTTAGYGTIWWNEKDQYVHRLSAELYLPDFKKELCVLHKCDNPACFNPAHLFLGTKRDNYEDAIKKGRRVRGSGKQDKCDNGHNMTPDNLYIYPDGHRQCKKCRRMYRDSRMHCRKTICPGLKMSSMQQ